MFAITNPMNFSVLLLLVTILPLQAQDVDNWASRTLREGLPPFPPLARKPIEQPHYAIIPVPDSAFTVNIIWGSRNGNPYPWLLHERPDGKTVGQLRTELIGPDTYESQVDLRFRPGFEGVTPLRLLFLPKSRILLYKWLESSSGLPGGRPTVIINPMDPGTLFPDLELHPHSGASYNISQFHGAYTFIVYGDAGCSAFQADKPGIDSLASVFSASGQNVSFLAVAPDTKAERTFLKDNPFTFPHAFVDEISMKVLGRSFPRYTIISPEGVVLYDNTGGGIGMGRRMGDILEKVMHRQ